MEPEGSLPHAQQLAGCPCPEPINAVYWLKAKLFIFTAGLRGYHRVRLYLRHTKTSDCNTNRLLQKQI